MDNRVVLLCLSVLGLAGCRKAEVSVYTIPKDQEAVATATAEAPKAGMPVAPTTSGAAAANPMTGTVPGVSGQALTWTAPAGWVAKPPGATRKGSFQVGADGDLSITAFPGDVGGELANLNRWRGQVGLPAVTQASDAGIDRAEANGLKMAVVDYAGNGQRILGAIVPLPSETWFFKLSGTDAAIEAQKTAFRGFLNSVRPAAK